MRDTIYKHIMIGAVVSIFTIILLTPALALAQEPEVAGIKIIFTPGADLNVNIYNYTTKAYDKKITWSNVDLSQPRGWILADQCLEISHKSPNPSWGIQIYTDNKNNTSPYAKSYTGKQDPAGLVGQTSTTQALSMAWIAYANWNPAQAPLPDEPVEKPYGLGGGWHWLKDRNTPENEDTEASESFHNAEDYVTIWNQKGVAVGDREDERAANPSKIYLFLVADFSKATKQAYKTNSLTFELFTESEIEIFPFYLYKDGAPALQMAYEFISGKMDKYFGGNQKRLIESYGEPYPPRVDNPKDNLWSIAFTYDNALAICAYLARPTEENLFRAKLLCKSFIWAQENDPIGNGRLRDAYDATKEFTGTTPPLTDKFFQSSSTGNIAWVINALVQYYKNSGDKDTAFLDEVTSAAKAAGDFIHNNFYHSSQPGYYYGYTPDGTLNKAKSTEHNIVVYVAFSHLYDVTGEDKWLQRANNAKNFVENISWNSQDKRYICGVNPDGSLNTITLVADTNLLPALAFGDSTRSRDAVSYAMNKFYKQDNILGLEGVDYGYYRNASGEPDGIWFEGTAMLAAAYKVAGNAGESNKYLESLKLAQYSAPNADYKSIVAASKDGLTTGFDWRYYASPHIASTAWFTACKMNYNMFWGTSLNEPVPNPGDDKSFPTPDPALLKDKTDYLENHYYPSGWMNYAPGGVFTDARCSDNPHLGDTCFKIHWTGQSGADGWKWAGIVWQEPENEWTGGSGKGYDLRGADYLSFWARTDSWSLSGDEPLQIKVYFGYAGDSSGETPPAWRSKLTTEWKQYIIPVLKGDMSHLSNGFSVIFNDSHTSRADNKCNIYIDDIEYKKF